MPTHGELMAITRLHSAAHAVSLLVGQLLDDAFLLRMKTISPCIPHEALAITAGRRVVIRKYA